jgi:hypothetical protein
MNNNAGARRALPLLKFIFYETENFIFIDCVADKYGNRVCTERNVRRKPHVDIIERYAYC